MSLLILALLWDSLADITQFIFSAWSSKAFFAPKKLGTNTELVNPEILFAACRISSESKNWGTIFSGTKEVTSISLKLRKILGQP